MPLINNANLGRRIVRIGYGAAIVAVALAVIAALALGAAVLLR